MTERPARPLRLLIVIGSLEYGGAERQAIELVNNFDRTKVDPYICSLSSEVPLANTLKQRDQRLFVIKKKGRFDFTLIFQLRNIIEAKKIDIVHAFLFDAEIASRLSTALTKQAIVVSSERNAHYRRSRLHLAALWLTRSLSSGMIANSNAGKQFNIKSLRLPSSKIRVVHNGIDTTRFYSDTEAAIALRTKLGIKLNAPIVGIVASFKTQKRHTDFFRVAKKITEQLPETHFLLAGEPLRDDHRSGKDYKKSLLQLIRNLEIEDNCHFLGNRSDIENVYRACDITILTSSREGTPNVLLESMACGTPVVATDIADNAIIVRSGFTGFIRPLMAIDELASSSILLLKDSKLRDSFSSAAKHWVQENFSIQALTEKTFSAYKQFQTASYKPSSIL